MEVKLDGTDVVVKSPDSPVTEFLFWSFTHPTDVNADQ